MHRIGTIIAAAAIAVCVPAGSAMAATTARSIAPISSVVTGPIVVTPAPPTPEPPAPEPPTPEPPSTTLHPLGAHLPTGHGAATRLRIKAAPPGADLTEWAVPVGDQRNTESCVAWTFAYDMLGWYARHNGFNGQPFAPMYAYNYVDHGRNSGTFPRDVLKVLTTRGEVPQVGYGGSSVDYQHVPTASEDSAAQAYRIAGFKTLFSDSNGAGAGGMAAIETSIAGGTPVGITLPVRPGFDYLGHAATDVDDDTTGTIRGGHEVMAVAYDQSGLLIQNSWGTSWGHNGYGRLSWNVVQHDVLEAETLTPPTVVDLGFATVSSNPHLSIPSGTDARLGVASQAVETAGDGIGELEGFNDEWVVSSPSAGAWLMKVAPTLSYWSNAGAGGGTFGYPTADYVTAANGGISQTFEHGAIVSDPTYGTHGVTGKIYDSWVDQGALGGRLGVPTSGTFSSGDVVTQPQTCQEFVGGTVCVRVAAPPPILRLTP